MYVIGYDIANARRRARVRQRLRRVTPFWQNSFFVVEGSQRDTLTLLQELVPLLDERSDGLVMAAVSPPAPGQGLGAAVAPQPNGIFLLE